MSKQGTKQGAAKQGKQGATTTATVAGETLLRIPVSAIMVEEGFNVREEASFVDEELQQLAESMGSTGQKNPIRVIAAPGKEGKYVLTDGERRYRAAKLLVKKHPEFTLQAIVTDESNASPLDRAITQFVANGGRPFSHYEQARLIERLESMGVEPKDIATKLGIQQQMVYNFLKAIKVGEEGLEALRKGEVSLTTLTDIARKSQVEAAPEDSTAKGRGKNGKVVDGKKAKAILKETVDNARKEAKEKGLEKPKKATARHNTQGSTRTVQTVVKELHKRLCEKKERNGAEESACELLGLILDKASDRKIAEFFKQYQ